MSDASTPPPQDDTGEALSRLASDNSRETKKTERRSGSGPLVFIGILIPLAVAGWVAWQQMELQREVSALRADNEALRQESGTDTNLLDSIQQRQQVLDSALQQRDAELDATLQQRAQELEAMLRDSSQQVLRQAQDRVAESSAATAAQAERLAVVERNLTALQRDLGREETDGVPLAEAELLLRFAQQRLLIARDAETAVALYRQADDVLRGVNDPALFSVRDMLARELAALEAAPSVDVSGLFTRLGALSARVGSFGVVVDGAVQDFTVQPLATDAAANDWWSSVKQTLGQYFVVTRSTADIAPQLGSGEQFLLRTLVQLHIEQARLALLNAEPQLYRAALDDAANVARRWLRGENGALDDFVAALEELRDTAIVSELPDVGDAVVALQQVTGVNTSAPSASPPPSRTPEA
ncbi:MAG: uroporphyrinogen-III C-methyltransferase, partial [Pseudomonadota bacterium]|nr:uroporphyrinogen-III C-methyltransferase [Pseudomonadota bacterium]